MGGTLSYGVVHLCFDGWYLNAMIPLIVVGGMSMLSDSTLFWWVAPHVLGVVPYVLWVVPHVWGMVPHMFCI